jgi:hypothetical protein
VVGDAAFFSINLVVDDNFRPSPLSRLFAPVGENNNHCANAQSCCTSGNVLKCFYYLDTLKKLVTNVLNKWES